MGLNSGILKYCNNAERLAGCICADYFKEEATTNKIFTKTGTGISYNETGEYIQFSGDGSRYVSKQPMLSGNKGSIYIKFSLTTAEMGASAYRILATIGGQLAFLVYATGQIRSFNITTGQLSGIGTWVSGKEHVLKFHQDGTAARGGVDGLSASIVWSANNNIMDGELILGHAPSFTPNLALTWSGKIYEVKVFRGYEFSTSELLATDYNALFDLEDGIVGKWLMREQDNYSTYTKDISGEGNNLTKNGTLDKFEGKRGYELDSATVDYLSGSISGLTDFSLILLLQNTKIGSAGELFYLTTPATTVDIADDGTITNGCGGDFYANKELSGDGKMENQFWIFGLLGATWGGSNFSIGGKMEGGILGAILYDGTLSPLQYFYFLAELFFNRGCN